MAISVPKIFKIIQDGYSNHGDLGREGETEILDLLTDVSLLILDDLGIENKTYWAYEKLYNIIDERYRANKPLIITTNFTIDDLRGNLAIMDRKTGERDESDRIFSRIVQMCTFIKVKGESWREQISDRNKDELFRELELSNNSRAEIYKFDRH
jgi:DNA replication protein DnaC